MIQSLLAITPGPYVMLQDRGRPGLRRLGVSGSGAMDRASFHLANYLVGNAPDEPSLEFAHAGGLYEVAADTCRIAITGGNFALSCDGIPLAPWRSHTLPRGRRFQIGGTQDAVWGYLAIAGGFATAPQLGSSATHLRSGLGGMGGRCVAPGDSLPLRTNTALPGPERRVTPPPRQDGPMRVIPGPQQDFFTPDAVETFYDGTYRITHKADRMGVWLDGPAIRHAAGFNIVSDGVVPGCIQIPGIGQPLVLLMDCQTIGGYPKLATLITADLTRFGQTRPSAQVRFAPIGIEAAQLAYAEHQARIEGLGHLIEDLPATGPSRGPALGAAY